MMQMSVLAEQASNRPQRIPIKCFAASTSMQITLITSSEAYCQNIAY